jgi:hypothetical protein
MVRLCLVMTVETELLSYEKYLAMPEVNRRYDIIDGGMIFI